MRVHAFIILAIAAVLCGAPSPASATGPNSLSAPQASPTSATTETSVSFSVTYAGGFAARTVTVNVAGRTLPMGLVGGTEMQGTWSAAGLVPQGTWEATFLAVASQGKDPSATGPTAPTAPAAPAASGAAAPRSPERTSAAEKTSIPAEPALGPIDLMVGAGGVAALTLFAWFVLLPPGDVGQRRRTDRSTMSGPGAEALPKRK